MTADRRAALIEAMARAMEKADSHAYEYQQTSSWEHLAEAAIDIVLEEAARVAEVKGDEWATEWRAGLKCDSHLEGKSDGADDVAAAIRALKGERT